MCGRHVLHPFGFDAFGLPAEHTARTAALDNPRIAERLSQADIARVIYVPGRIINFVTKPQR